jgi:hypothetical protein
VRKIGSHQTLDQQRDIALKRARLQERVETFQKQAVNILQAASEGGDDSWDSILVRETDVGVEFDGIGEGEDDDEYPSSSEERNHTQVSAILVQSISLCIFPQILDEIGAIEMLPKT